MELFAIGICALCAVPVAFAAEASNLWVAVGIIGLATAAHQGFSANLYALPGDVFPRSAVGSVVGIGGMLGAIGGMAMAIASKVVEREIQEKDHQQLIDEFIEKVGDAS